jgi:hypothetical protein
MNCQQMRMANRPVSASVQAPFEEIGAVSSLRFSESPSQMVVALIFTCFLFARRQETAAGP